MFKKKTLFFLFYILTTFLLLTYQGVKGPIEPFYYINYPLNYINETVSFTFNKIKEYLKTSTVIREENERVKEELRTLKIKHQLYEEVLKENERLKELLSFKDSVINYVTTAKVIAGNPNNWNYTLTLDKGSLDGIKKDMAVNTLNGLAGKILYVNRHYSTVLLITDPNSSVAVRQRESRINGILSGKGMYKCELKYIPNDEDVEIGEELITSGLDSLYPSGIPVGRIKSVRKGTGDFFQTISVEPYIDPLTLEEVMILRNDREDE